MVDNFPNIYRGLQDEFDFNTSFNQVFNNNNNLIDNNKNNSSNNESMNEEKDVLDNDNKDINEDNNNMVIDNNSLDKEYIINNDKDYFSIEYMKKISEFSDDKIRIDNDNESCKNMKNEITNEKNEIKESIDTCEKKKDYLKNRFISTKSIFTPSKYSNKIIFILSNEQGIERADNYRKKYKTAFFKDLKKWLEKSFTIKCKFKRTFVADVSKKQNRSMLQKTLKEIIEEFNNKKDAILNNKKFKRYDYLFNKTMKELFNEYFISSEFEKSYKKINNPIKLNNLLLIGKDFINYFSKSKLKQETKTNTNH